MRYSLSLWGIARVRDWAETFVESGPAPGPYPYLLPEREGKTKEAGQVPPLNVNDYLERLWLRHPRSLGGLGQIARARFHFDRLGHLGIFPHSDLLRGHRSVTSRNQVESKFGFDIPTVAIELWSEGFPVRVF